MSSYALAAALAAGVTIVTPNNRLARTLVARHDAAMARAGHRTWQAARALPWHAWLQALWRDAGDAGAIPSGHRLLAAVESRYVWERIVATDTAVHASLLNPRGAAALAEDAWDLMHAWGAGGPSWRAWPGTLDAPADSDPAAFAQWAERYHRELERLSALDMARLPDALAQAAAAVPDWRGQTVALAGFLELAPRQERLLEHLLAAGMAITVVPAPSGPVFVQRAAAGTPREEVRTALAWARRQADESPDRFIGIAIENLAARRDEVKALADEVLCPALQLPGHAGAPRPYSLSLGLPLAETTVVATALALLALAQGTLGSTEAAALLRSTCLPGPWTGRARCERSWLDESRATISWDDALAALARFAPALAARWRAISPRASRPGAHPPRLWVTRWRDLLRDCGWPGDDALEGPDFEARNAWEQLLEEFARIGHVDAKMSADGALQVLRDLAGRAIFQPDAPPAAIAIMGLLEAVALPFDALWVAGLSAQRWPPAPQPNPLLPMRWQRGRNVQRSSAARELAYSRVLTASLAHGAAQVVMSAPTTVDDHPSTPSALIPADALALATPPVVPDSGKIIATARVFESVIDERVPALMAGELKGGAGVIAAQSDCPFRATALYRMQAEPWPRAAEGLNYMERGQLVHATMATFWRDLRTHAALQALDAAALEQRIGAAVASARGAVAATRWRLLPPAVAVAESARIARISATWISGLELPRPAFVVAHVEWSTSVTLSGLTLRLQLDRVDALPDGGRVIIDYKTGHVDAPKTWFAMRPRAPQLGLYALALRGGDAASALRAVAYAKLKAGEIAVLGLAADAAAWPALTDVAKLPELGGWTGVEQWWARHLADIANEVREGVATVTPRDNGAPCRHCGLQSLCRIGAVGLAAVGEAAGVSDGDE